MAQDYPNIEIVISDDGTPGFEECAPLLVAHVEKHSEPRRSLVLNPIKVNAGTVKNVNSAIRLAHGRYIKTISPDDAFSVDCAISDYVKFMEENDYLVCFAKMRGVGEDGTVYRLSLIHILLMCLVMVGWGGQKTARPPVPLA